MGYLYLGAVEISSDTESDSEDEESEFEEKSKEVEEDESETNEIESQVTENTDEESSIEVIDYVEADIDEIDSEEEENIRAVRKKLKKKRRRKQYKQKQKTKKQVDETRDENQQEAVSWEVHMPAENGTIEFKVDTGADVTIIPDTDLTKLGLERDDIRRTRKKLFGANKQRIQCLGYVSTRFTWGDKTEKQIVYVCKNIRRALLGKPAINKFNIIQMNIPESYSCGKVDAVDESQDKYKEKTLEEEFNEIAEKHPILKKFKKVFTKLGNINAGDEVNIRVKEGTQPYQTYSPRHIPLPLLGKVIEELKRMESLGVIRKMDKPTQWCHPIVIVSKPSGEIRLCIDLTKLNTGVERELYQLEAVDETIGKLGDDCVYMSKLDANSGYWQVPLNEKSQELTTFITPVGRFCCTRGPYGLSSMQEIFSKKMDIVIEGLKGVVKSTDDFLVYAKTKKELEDRTEKLLERFEKYGVTVNVRKCLFERKEMDFLGHRITKDGIRPLQSKMEAIRNFPQPTNITELRRFMGMANQMAKFSPKLAESSAPLRDLLSSKNSWLWTSTHSEAFEAVKEVIMSPETLRLYDPSRPTKIRVDGSKLNGIAVILYQQHGEKWYPVACGSRYLKDAEKNYYPIENEMLAVTWGCQRMNLYLQGLPHFIVETDHKPLIPILNSKSLIDMSPRIQNMRMKQLRYSFTAQHVKGTNMEDADALSRSPHEKPDEKDNTEEEISCHINEVIKSMPVSTRYMGKIKEETKQDKTLQTVKEVMMKGWPNSKQECPKEVKPFWDSRHDITEVGGVLVKGTRLIIPAKLQKEVLERLHSAHQGMGSSKRRARQTCFWPSMNKDVESMIGKCSECLKHKPAKVKEELKPHSVPTRPWEKIATDLFELHKKHYLVITDYYSLWPELYELKITSSRQIIEVMKEVFARHGIPTQLVSDNGSQYKSHLFKKFAKSWDFKHTTSSPRYPQSNGFAESSVKNMKGMVKKCLATNKDIRKGLLTIRNTPLTCGKSPAELLMGRQLNDNLPRLPALMDTNEPGGRNMIAERAIQKKHHDKKIAGRQRTEEFHKGQWVAIQDPDTKLWILKGRIIEEVAPRSYNVQIPGRGILRRNRKHLRKVQSTTSTFQPNNELDDSELSMNDEENNEQDSENTETTLSDSDATQPYDEDSDGLFELDQTESPRRSRRTLKIKKPLDYDDL